MSDTNPRPRRSKASPKNTFTTKSGNTIKLNRSLSDRVKANKEAKARRKAAYLSTLPKEKWKRILYRMHPKRVIRYWFSRQGALMALKIAGISVVVIFLVIVGLFAYFRKDLPNIKDISGNGYGGSITYYDRTGKTILWQDYNAKKRIPVQGDSIATFMKDATVAVEDKDFFHEGAFNVKGIARAALNNASGGNTQGGSTITQQLVKLNEGWTNDHTVSRKVKELILAVELEREFSKQDILTGYLNFAPYGGVDYGVESAARDYFGVDASQLSLAQASMLASIPKAPGTYSPYSSTKFNDAVTVDLFDQAGLISRQHYVLDSMVKQHYITQDQADAAKKVDVVAQVKPLETRYAGIKAPYFVLAAKQELNTKLGTALAKNGGFKVITTLDLNLQNSAEQLVANNIANLNKRTLGLADEQALITEDTQTGQIVESVGGQDFNADNDYSKLNFAASQVVSPGSTFKPYDYAAFIDGNTNVGAGSVLYDSSGTIPGYACPAKCATDYDFGTPGPITLRYAIGGSRNIPAMKAMLSSVPNDTSNEKTASVNKTISVASAMMDNPSLQQQKMNTYNCMVSGADVNNPTPDTTQQCGTSSAIGDGAYLKLDDHINGLSTLSRLGGAIPRTYLLQVTNASNKDVYKWEQPQSKQVIKADTAYILNNMLDDPRASYLPGSCSATNCTPLSSFGYKFQRYNGWDFAIKTGTTNFGFDGLMASWSTKYAVLSWVGNHTRNVDITAHGATMELLTAPLTRGMMEAAHTNLKPVNWTQPTDIKTLPAFVINRKVSVKNSEQLPSPSTDVFPASYVAKSGSNSSQTLDKVSGKVATSCTPDLAKQTQTNSNANSWNVDIFQGGSPSSNSSVTTTTGTQATDDVHDCSDTKPTIQITAINGAAVSSSNPSSCPANSSTNGCDVKVLVQQGTHPLTDSAYASNPGTINLLVNGQTVDTKQISDSGNYDFLYKPDAGTTGTVQFSVQVVDSVLYSGTDSGSLTFGNKAALLNRQNVNESALASNRGRGNNLVVDGGIA